jgi:hypothetical protein
MNAAQLPELDRILATLASDVEFPVEYFIMTQGKQLDGTHMAVPGVLCRTCDEHTRALELDPRSPCSMQRCRHVYETDIIQPP